MRRVLATLLMALPLVGNTHNFVIKPDRAEIEAGQSLGFSVLMTETLFEGERSLQPDKIRVHLLGAAEPTPITLSNDAPGKRLRGELPAPKGIVVLSAVSEPRYRSIEKGLPMDNPATTLRIDEFSKALVNLDEPGDGYALRSGDRLELVPLDNPARLEHGADLRIKVLFEGQPLACRLAAMSPGKKRLVVQTDKHGVATLRLPTPGFWLVRSSYALRESDNKSSHYEASANLLFALD